MYENLDDQFTAEQRALSPGEIKSPYGEATNLSKVANNNFLARFRINPSTITNDNHSYYSFSYICNA